MDAAYWLLHKSYLAVFWPFNLNECRLWFLTRRTPPGIGQFGEWCAWRDILGRIT